MFHYVIIDDHVERKLWRFKDAQKFITLYISQSV